MNILVLCLSPGKGGLELYAHRSTEIVQLLGHRCVTVCNSKSSVFKSNSESENNTVYSLNISFHIFPFIAALKLARIIDSQKIDIVNMHWSRDFNIAVFAKIFSSRNIKLIYTRHMALTRYKNDLYHRFLYSHVDQYLVITRQLKKEAIQFLPLPESKIKLLYHGIKRLAQNRLNCDKFELSNGTPNCLHIAIFSRIEAGKGHHLLVETVRALKLKNKEIHVTVIGHIMDEQYFKELKATIKQYEIENLFQFHHFIENAASYMSCFDIVALTTYAETFGLVLIEAMHAGVAVIGSDAGGVPEIINDKITGLLFTSRDAKSLTKKIEFYYDNPERRKEIAVQGQRFVELNFSEEQHQKALNEILLSL